MFMFAMCYPQPKPEPQKRRKDRRTRQEAKIIRAVRKFVVARDGYCRVGSDECEGPSQWAHFADKKRYLTRGQDAEERHTTPGSLMLCQKHHDRYDGRRQPRLFIEPKSDRGADGPLIFELGDL